MADSEHLRISEIPGYRPQQGPIPPSYAPPLRQLTQEPHKSFDFTRWLWVFASTFLILLNVFAGLVSVRDMYLTTYNSYNHYFMTSAFALTIGVLAVIHTYIIRKE